MTMLGFNHISTNYSDFAYRLEDFFMLIASDKQRLTKLDALLLYSMIRGAVPDRVIEIGRFHGTSTMTICGALCDNNHGRLDSVDIEDLTSMQIKDLVRDWATEYVLDSSLILEHDLLKQQRYQMCFIDGDHSVYQQLKDIQTCLHLADHNSWIIMHDADLPETHRALELACAKYTELMDVGRFGDQLHLLKKI